MVFSSGHCLLLIVFLPFRFLPFVAAQSEGGALLSLIWQEPIVVAFSVLDLYHNRNANLVYGWGDAGFSGDGTRGYIRALTDDTGANYDFAQLTPIDGSIYDVDRPLTVYEGKIGADFMASTVVRLHRYILFEI
jgi:hypothetical protein